MAPPWGISMKNVLDVRYLHSQLCVTLSGLYVHHLSHKRERDLLASVAGVLALAASLLSSALLPVDVFLVSFMKDAQGNFKARLHLLANESENLASLRFTVVSGTGAFTAS